MGPVKIALVTGANKGIGKEIAKGLAQKGFTVLLGARKKELGETAAAELAQYGNVSFQQLDITDVGSVTAAAELITSRFGHLDVLVNNAGIARDPGQELIPLTEIPVEEAAKQFAGVYYTNVFAVVTVTNTFLPLLHKAPAARIVNVSSKLASIGNNMTLSRAAAYSTSKTALNALTVHYAKDLQDSTIKVNSVCPGHCATDLNDFRGPRTPSQGAAIAVVMAMLPADGPTGGFFDDDGPIIW